MSFNTVCCCLIPLIGIGNPSREKAVMPPTVFTSPETAQFSQITSLLNESVNIIAVVGAGISTSCGIPAFRGGPDGIYAKYGKHVFDYIQVHSDKIIGMKYLQMVIIEPSRLDWGYESNC